MTTVQEASYELLRKLGMTTMFGNPGSTELPFLDPMPSDFRYVLGLQEAIVVGMADGFAQASGTPALVNLHTTPGIGNAMGAIVNAQANKTPMLVTAGQQMRRMMTFEALLTNRDATTLPKPAVKWSYEPPRAQDVPAALARAAYVAMSAPAGPAFVSIPMDDWRQEADEEGLKHALKRDVELRRGPDPGAMAELAKRLSAAENPVLVTGGEVDVSGAWDDAVTLAEKLALPVFSAPATGEGRLGFPESHPHFKGILPPAIGPVSEVLKEHDLVLVLGAAVFTYYPYIPGPLLGEGTSVVQITEDPDEAARAPMGNSIVGDVKLALDALLPQLERSGREPPPEPWPQEDPPEEDPMNASALLATLAEVFPENGILVNESPSNTLATRNRIRISRPRSYLFGAGGGLGFGLPAAIGAQMGAPERPVVGLIGDGSMQYAIAALWTAAAYEVPVTIVVPRNEEYAILKWFGELEGAQNAPGLDVRGLDVVAIASGYGIRARAVSTRDELRTALGEAIGSGKPELVEARIGPGMALA